MVFFLGPRRIFTPGEIQHTGKTNEVHTVRLGRVGREGWLQVDNLPNVTGTSPGWLTQLNTQPLIYIGNKSLQQIIILYFYYNKV